MLWRVGPNLTPESRRLLVQQRSVIASWQAASVGMTSRQLRWACRTGWQSVTAHTFLAAEGDITEAQMRVAGVLEAGPDAALAGCSALIEAGWSGDSNGYVDVVVARGHRSRRTPTPPWLRMHTTLDVPRRWGAPPQDCGCESRRRCRVVGAKCPGAALHPRQHGAATSGNGGADAPRAGVAPQPRLGSPDAPNPRRGGRRGDQHPRGGLPPRVRAARPARTPDAGAQACRRSGAAHRRGVHHAERSSGHRGESTASLTWM